MKGPFNNIDDGMSQDDSEHIGDFSSPEASYSDTQENGEIEHHDETLHGENDLIRLYIKTIGAIPLLSREREVEIAKKIEASKSEILDIIFTTPFCMRKLISIGELVKKGEMPLSELINDAEELAHNDLLEEKNHFERIISFLKTQFYRREKLQRSLWALHNNKTRKAEKLRNHLLLTLGKNKQIIISHINNLRFKDEVLCSLSNEFKNIVVEFENLQKKLNASIKGTHEYKKITQKMKLLKRLSAENPLI